MSKVTKSLFLSVGLCITGAILLDCHIWVTGYTMLALGAGGIFLSPFADTL